MENIGVLFLQHRINDLFFFDLSRQGQRKSLTNDPTDINKNKCEIGMINP